MNQGHDAVSDEQRGLCLSSVRCIGASAVCLYALANCVRARPTLCLSELRRDASFARTRACVEVACKVVTARAFAQQSRILMSLRNRCHIVTPHSADSGNFPLQSQGTPGTESGLVQHRHSTLPLQLHGPTPQRRTDTPSTCRLLRKVKPLHATF